MNLECTPPVGFGVSSATAMNVLGMTGFGA